MPIKRPRRKSREVRGIRLDQQQWVAYRLSILSGYNVRGLAAMYTKRFRITVAQWLTPDGHAIQGEGLQPDQAVAGVEGQDAPLDAAILYLSQKLVAHG